MSSTANIELEGSQLQGGTVPSSVRFQTSNVEDKTYGGVGAAVLKVNLDYADIGNPSYGGSIIYPVKLDLIEVQMFITINGQDYVRIPPIKQLYRIYYDANHFFGIGHWGPATTFTWEPLYADYPYVNPNDYKAIVDIYFK